MKRKTKEKGMKKTVRLNNLNENLYKLILIILLSQIYKNSIKL